MGINMWMHLKKNNAQRGDGDGDGGFTLIGKKPLLVLLLLVYRS